MFTNLFACIFVQFLLTHPQKCNNLSINKNTEAFQTLKLNTKYLASSQPQMVPMPEGDFNAEKIKHTSNEINHDLLVDKLRKTAASIREQTRASESTKEEREKETTSWFVILHNDDVHSFQFVTETLAKCIPHLSLAKAHTITVQAHSNGQATILATWRDRANMYCESLQSHGLTVSTMHTNQNTD